MDRRIDWTAIAPGAYRAMIGVEQYVRESGLERPLLELVKVRASQINGCAYCLEMHTREAREAGETEQRLHLVAAWREAPFYSARERAALDWAEHVTRISDDGVPEHVYQAARAHFTEQELINLTMALVAINGWNRLAVSFRTPVGS